MPGGDCQNAQAMNRRGFISNLATILAASTAPNVMALEAFDRFRWKVPPGKLVAVINPDWVNAPYEYEFLVVTEQEMESISLPFPPVRFRTLEDAQANRNWIPPWIAKEA